MSIMKPNASLFGSGATRRRLLKYAAQSAAAAAASVLMPPNVQKVLAQGPPKQGLLKDIKHVVMLMQENRSFDHYFGTMAGVRGFDDPARAEAAERQIGLLSARRRESRRLPAAVPSGHARPPAPRRFPPPATPGPCSTTRGTAARWTTGCPRIARPTASKAPYVMGYHTRADIPFQFALAEAFTICDAYHCSVIGPTWPNRMYWMTGTIDPDGDRRRADHQQHGSAGRLPLDHLRRAAGKGRRQLEGLPAGGQLRLQHAGELQGVPGGRRRDSPLYTRGMRSRARRAVRVRRRATTSCRPSPGSSRRAISPSIRTTCRPPARRSSPARSTRSPPTRRSGPRPSSFSTTTRTTASSTTSRRPSPPPGTPRRIRRTACRSAAASACRASSSRRGRPAAGSAASRSITRRCCSSWRNSPA